jgi:peptidoglycan/LPS O-acetylase OafA/YrhL
MTVWRIAKAIQWVLGATTAVAIVALIQAGCWVALHDGFGMGDLYALAIWSLPFGVLVALAGVVLRRWKRPKRRAVRGTLAAASGAMLGLLWTLAMMQMMGPWFGTFSFPVLPILTIAGALTLGVVVSCLPKRVIDA